MMLKDAEIFIVIANTWLGYKMLVQLLISIFLEIISKINLSSLSNLYRLKSQEWKPA